MKMSDGDFDRFETADDEENLVVNDQAIALLNGWAVWKIVSALLVAMVVILIVASIVCGTNEQCRNHVPTLQNMLDSHLTSPFVTTAVNAMQMAHVMLVLALFTLTKDKALHWSILQFLVATLFHVVLFMTLFLVVFLGWDRNWANVGAIVVWMMWMLLVMKSLKKHHRYRTQRIEVTLLKWNWVCLAIFFISTVIYVVFRALRPTQMDFKGKDTAVLVSEILGGLSALGFMILLIFHTRKVTHSMYAPK